MGLILLTSTVGKAAQAQLHWYLAITCHCHLKLGLAAFIRNLQRPPFRKKVVWIGAGKLGFPESAMLAFSLGCDMVNVAREAMISIGCIQALRCHTNHCPAGVATQNHWLARGLDPTLKSVRAANYIATLRKEILRTSWAAGVCHPALLQARNIEILDSQFEGRSVAEVFGYRTGWATPCEGDQRTIKALMGAVEEPVKPKRSRTITKRAA